MVEHPIPARVVVREPAPRQTLTAAKRAVFEASNRVLLLALACVCAALFAVLAWTHGIYLASLDRSPLYFGIQPDGNVMQLRPEALKIEITDEILRNQIEGFVAKHYSRLPAISARDYRASLLMMDSALTGSGTAVRDNEKQIDELDQSPMAHEQVDAVATNSTYEGTAKDCKPEGQPCIATVYMTRRFMQGGTLARQSNSIVKVTFVVLKKIKMDPDMVRWNPVGIVITGFYLSEAHAQ